jgi:hypothetical protein
MLAPAWLSSCSIMGGQGQQGLLRRPARRRWLARTALNKSAKACSHRLSTGLRLRYAVVRRGPGGDRARRARTRRAISDPARDRSINPARAAAARRIDRSGHQQL